MRFMCEKCRGIVHVDDKLAGGKVKCGHCGEVVTVPRTNTSPGAIIGDFVIEREINRGGMGIVYLAQQMSLEREVALKILLQKYASDTEFVTQFIREARSAAKLNHPNIVQAYAVGEENGTFYFAMEFIDGETMKDVLKRENIIPVKRAAAIIKDIAEALDFAWREQRIVHHDIKPDNIMVTTSGRAKLADLGLAKVAGDIESDNEDEEVLGTPQYISPEQLTGSPTDVRSDLYSLGATFYHFVTGRFPYIGENPNAIARQHLDGTLIPPCQLNKDVPRRISDIICRMMAKDPKQRYQSADAVARELGRFIEENSTRTELLALKNLRERGIAGAQAGKKRFLIPVVLLFVGLCVAFTLSFLIFPKQMSRLLGKTGVAPMPPAAPQQPVVKPGLKPVVKPVPTGPVTRTEFLEKVDVLLDFYKKHTGDERLFLTEADKFFTGRLYPPRTAEETRKVAELSEIYNRIDERLRVIPMRQDARKRHLRDIDRRKEYERRRAEEEARRRAWEQQQAREREARLRRQREKEDEERRIAEKRAVEYVRNMNDRMMVLPMLFMDSVRKGDETIFRNAANALRRDAALPGRPHALERSKNAEVIKYINQLSDELPRVSKVANLFNGKDNRLQTFQFGPNDNDLVRVTGIGSEFGTLKVKSSLNGATAEYSMNDKDVRQRLVKVAEKRLKINGIDFYYQIAAGNFTRDLSREAPNNSYWRFNYSTFLRNYFRAMWNKASQKERAELQKRYGDLVEFRQVTR